MGWPSSHWLLPKSIISLGVTTWRHAIPPFHHHSLVEKKWPWLPWYKLSKRGWRLSACFPPVPTSFRIMSISLGRLWGDQRGLFLFPGGLGGFINYSYELVGFWHIWYAQCFTLIILFVAKIASLWTKWSTFGWLLCSFDKSPVVFIVVLFLQ